MPRAKSCRFAPILALSLVVLLFASGVAWAGWTRSPVDGVAVEPSGSVVTPDTSQAGVGPADVVGTPPTQVLDRALAALAAEHAGVDFAVAVADQETGQTYAFGGDTPFITASIVKVEILAELLVQMRQEGKELSASQQQLAAQMIQHSDNDAADGLWEAVGESSGLATADGLFGLDTTTPGVDSWGLTTTTATDQVALLDAIAAPDGPLGADNSIVLDLMGSVEDDQSWGVSAAARDGETVELKNGWLSLSDGDGTWSVNSIGIIRGDHSDITIAVLSDGQATLDSGIAFVENIATLARNTLDPAS